jgi:nucleotide-binding universal stress UspA family protein
MSSESSPSGQHGIVVGVDGSPASRVAVDWAARDAIMRHIPLTLVHVQPSAEVAMWIDVPIPDGFWQSTARHAQQVIADALGVAHAAAGDRPIDVTSLTLVGNSVSNLVDLSKDAELVVVGCRGLGVVGSRLLGSVSAGVTRHAHCPVVVVHDEDPLMEHPSKAPVVVGIDGSPVSELATKIAFDEASRRGVDLVAVHTWIDVGPAGVVTIDWASLKPIAEEALAERLAGWQERYPDVTVHRVVTQDRPAHQLLKQAESAQLVVVGSHGRGGFAGLLLGSVGSAVVEQARQPVIIARQP